MTFKMISTFLGVALSSGGVMAQIKTVPVQYMANGTPLQGFISHDTSKKTPQPGILIVHDWMGLGDFQIEKAEKLAKEGYVAFAVDIYGKGVRPKNQEEAGQFATKYKTDRALLRARIRAAYDKLVSMKEVNPNKIIVIGYCFGGTTALELARSGVPLAGTVTFHGGLSTPTPNDAKNIKGRVLTLHGEDDPFVPPAEVAAFKDEMKKGNVKMEFVAYKGAVHAFTNPAAGNDNSKGAAYNANADKQSWIAFQKFLKDTLR